MPELPEVEGVVRTLAPEAIGRTIQTITVSPIVTESKEQGREAIIKGSSTEQFIESLQHMTIVDVTRRSKYIYMHLEKEGQTYLLVSHLGMTGAWFVVDDIHHIEEDKFKRHVHITFHMTDGGKLVYSDIRRFGEFRLLQGEADYPPLLLMAPEPFAEDACHYFLMKCQLPKYKTKAIKAVIMDGQVISGCGNIYATEALFRMGIHPNRKVERISEKRKIALFETIAQILQESIDAGGSSISDYRNSNGETGEMQNRLQMYGQKTCPICSRETKTMKIANRTSVYCPACQR